MKITRKTSMIALSFGAVSAIILGGIAWGTRTPLIFNNSVEICKVAGVGVPIGTEFSYDLSCSQTTDTVMVAAGPAPRGNCVRSGVSWGPWAVEVKETPLPGYVVSDITPNQGTGVSNTDIENGYVKLTSGDRRSVTYTNQRAASLKICKVAGEGIAIGTPFDFNINSSLTTTVTAGPAPGGFCEIVEGNFTSGETVTVTELSGSQFVTADIRITPIPDSLDVSLDAKKGSAVLTPGVTEFTFVNTANRTGYLEICKSGTAEGDFTFKVTPGEVPAMTVSAGSCSPAIKVPAGPVKIREQPAENSVMVGCETFPSTHQIGCDLEGMVSVVQVQGGDKSRQTIATIVNDKKL